MLIGLAASQCASEQRKNGAGTLNLYKSLPPE